MLEQFISNGSPSHLAERDVAATGRSQEAATTLRKVS